MGSAPIVTSLILGARSHCRISVSTALAYELEIHFLSLNLRLITSEWSDTEAGREVQVSWGCIYE